MKRNNAKRAEALMKALNGIPDLRRAMRKMTGKPPDFEGDRWAMTISVGAACDDGGGFDAWIEFDLATARKLIPHIEDVLGDELVALGAYPKKARQA